MSEFAIQQYFENNPVRKIERGNQSIIYGSKDLIIKVIEPRKISANMAAMAIGKENGKGFDPRIAADLRKMYEKLARDAYGLGKAKFGGCVVPFEMPQHVEATLKHWFSIWGDKANFYHPVVQERVNMKQSLRAFLDKAAKDGDVDFMRELIGAMIETNMALIERGGFPYDCHPTNYTVTGVDAEGHFDGVELIDVGGLILSRKKLTGLLKTEENKEQADKFRDMTIGKYEGIIRKLGDSEAANDLISDIRKRITPMFSPRILSRFGTKKGEPVPEVHVPA